VRAKSGWGSEAKRLTVVNAGRLDFLNGLSPNYLFWSMPFSGYRTLFPGADALVDR
jgi:hypothetical protein